MKVERIVPTMKPDIQITMSWEEAEVVKSWIVYSIPSGSQKDKNICRQFVNDLANELEK